LLDALGEYKDYILISSSAVYPEYVTQPFKEEDILAENKYWGKYGTDKIEAESTLLMRDSNAYILRPPYLYGPMNNVYREAFVFDCAMANRKFYLPQEGKMQMQFFNVYDLCRFIDIILENKPQQHVFNVGNKETISARKWVEICYEIAGKQADFVNVYGEIEQRNYFSFYNYEYYLDVSKQYELMKDVKSLNEGLTEAYNWYINNMDKVNKKPYMDYIDGNM
jgi:nucleoside-diphosphate-sugar epimerase